MLSDNVIEIKGLSKCYQIYDHPSDRLKQMITRGRKQYYKEFWALQDISLNIRKGETVGIIGRNGSGKSTLLQIICGTLSQTTGFVKTRGRVAALLELGSGFNPEFTGHENVYMNATLLGMTPDEIDARYEKIVNFADIGSFIDQPVKNYSSGMMVRLAFSVAIHTEPDVLIVDEALSVGDVYFQAKCAKMIQDIIGSGSTVLFVSHDITSIKSLCNRAILLDSGCCQYIGDVNTAVEKYYSALIKSQQQERALQEIETGAEATFISSEFTDGIDSFQSTAGFQRIQNGVAEFINVTLLNGKGEIIESVNFGEKVILRQVVRIHRKTPKLSLAYHIRDKNGQDIIYSDTQIEGNQHLVHSHPGQTYVIEWSFTVCLRAGNYVISSMLSEPINLDIGEVSVVDFVPISTSFSLSSVSHKQIYAAAYWNNKLDIRELKNVPN